jgi:GT2 family glycosyltransferase
MEVTSGAAGATVAAIVVNYGTPDLTIACVESLLESDGIDPHVFVIDNKSGDDSVVRLHAAFREHASVTVIERKKNDGYAGGNNAGFALARKLLARYAFVLNSDTTVHRDCLQLLVNEAEKTSDAAIVSPCIFFGEPSDRLWFGGGRFSLWRGRPVHIGFRKPAAEGLREISDIDFATGCAMLIRLDAPGVRDFDKSLFSYAEDLDLSLSVLEAGSRIRYVPEAIVMHFEGASHRKAGGESLRFYLSTRNLLRVDARHARWSHWITLGPMIAVDVIGRFVVVSLLRGDFSAAIAVLQGAWDSFAGGRHSIEGG